MLDAEAIGRNVMGNHNQPQNPLEGSDKNDYQAINDNPDRGGANFGVNDAGSWDDGGSADLGGGGGGWDN